MKQHAVHLLLVSLAAVLLVTGLVLMFSPIPFGIVLVGVALSLLVYSSDHFADSLTALRTRHHGLNAQLVWLETKLNRRIGFIDIAMRRTRPPE